jgi:hypothetical protein
MENREIESNKGCTEKSLLVNKEEVCQDVVEEEGFSQIEEPTLAIEKGLI